MVQTLTFTTSFFDTTQQVSTPDGQCSSRCMCSRRDCGHRWLGPTRFQHVLVQPDLEEISRQEISEPTGTNDTSPTGYWCGSHFQLRFLASCVTESTKPQLPYDTMYIINCASNILSNSNSGYKTSSQNPRRSLWCKPRIASTKSTKIPT